MKTTHAVPIAVFSAIVLFYVKEINAIKCYVCTDCDTTYNSSHLLNCSRNQDKCIKMHLMSGDVDRLCADKNRCAGRAGSRNKRSIEEVIEDSLPKRRTVRQLLGSDSGGSSNANKNKNNKEKEKQKEEKKGSKDAMELHCCAEDGCNGVLGLPSISAPLMLSCFLFVTVSSSVFSLHNLRQVN